MTGFLIQNKDMLCSVSAAGLKVCAAVMCASVLSSTVFCIKWVFSKDRTYLEKANDVSIPAVVCLFPAIAFYTALLCLELIA